MANICSTCYYIEGRKTTLKRIEKACNEKDYEKDILRALGIKKLDNRYLRGDVLDTDFRGEALLLHADEAWSRTDFAELLQKQFPSLKVYWYAEEPGFDIYCTNDSEGKYFTDRCKLDCHVGEICDSFYFSSEEEARAFVKDIAGISTDEEIEAFNNSEDSERYIYLHEIEIC